MLNEGGGCTHLFLDDKAHGSVVNAVGKVVALAGFAEIALQPEVYSKCTAYLALLRQHPVIGVENKSVYLYGCRHFSPF